MAKPKKSQIKQDLIDQLDRQGIYGQHYLDMVNDYLELWDIKNKLIKDIKKRGVTTRYQNGPDQWGHKKNDSIAELTKTSGQMLKILSELGLKARPLEIKPDDDDEM